ncbi:iron-containing alcohol dehydrogenase family protein [Synechococcus sp. CCY 9618]|uniref:iron-containing alcohol dehydrogenase family protein n=1 Tax=Synechococcus sp. CCY 9618 TaxID=2815602 RepID=UPI001C24711A|nr:iron-containing alcohol dehydrogenase family protein [Synechococcus sp. CCY 9618]
MTDPLQTHAIAPTLVLRGPGAWARALPSILALGRRPLLLGRSAATFGLRQQLAVDLERAAGRPRISQGLRDCCEEDLGSLAAEAGQAGCDAVIAAGGGKVLDAGKLLAHRLGLPCITVPTSAATCAGWTALANLYTPEGAFLGDLALDRCPDLLVFDHDLVRQAPSRTLASGIADALAKWYESSVSSGSSGDGLVQQAVQMARILRDLLLLEGESALADPQGDAWVRVAEACALTAGLIGGIGGARCRTVAAHAVHNGLTQLAATHGNLHGEKVGFGVLVQLGLEEQLAGNRLAAQARRQLLPFFRQLGLPTDLEALGLAGATLEDLREVCRFACRPDSDLHRLPFAVGPEDLLAAMVGAAADRHPA